MARGLVGADHSLQFRHARSQALKEADLVIIAGMPCDFRLNYGRSINKKAYHVAINRSKEDLKKNKSPDIAIQADPGSFLLELTAKGKSNKDQVSEWVDVLRKREGEAY